MRERIAAVVARAIRLACRGRRALTSWPLRGIRRLRVEGTTRARCADGGGACSTLAASVNSPAGLAACGLGGGFDGPRTPRVGAVLAPRSTPANSPPDPRELGIVGTDCSAAASIRPDRCGPSPGARRAAARTRSSGRAVLGAPAGIPSRPGAPGGCAPACPTARPAARTCVRVKRTSRCGRPCSFMRSAAPACAGWPAHAASAAAARRGSRPAPRARCGWPARCRPGSPRCTRPPGRRWSRS